MYKEKSPTKRSLIRCETTLSTNNDLKSIIKSSGEPVFSVVSASRQTEGRGRLGRSFFSPEGGLYFSFSLPLNGNEKNIPFVTLVAGLAVSEAIEELYGIRTEIKWPNDIYLNGKKLGGILCELISGKGLTAIVGAGINLSVQKESIPPELQDIMTSFAAEGLTVPEENALRNRIVEITDRYIYDDEVLYKESKELSDNIRSRSYSIGKKVKYVINGAQIWGTVSDINEKGAAVISLADGTKKEIFCGEISG